MQQNVRGNRERQPGSMGFARLVVDGLGMTVVNGDGRWLMEYGGPHVRLPRLTARQRGVDDLDG